MYKSFKNSAHPMIRKKMNAITVHKNSKFCLPTLICSFFPENEPVKLQQKWLHETLFVKTTSTEKSDHSKIAAW